MCRKIYHPNKWLQVWTWVYFMSNVLRIILTVINCHVSSSHCWVRNFCKEGHTRHEHASHWSLKIENHINLRNFKIQSKTYLVKKEYCYDENGVVNRNFAKFFLNHHWCEVDKSYNHNRENQPKRKSFEVKGHRKFSCGVSANHNWYQNLNDKWWNIKKCDRIFRDPIINQLKRCDHFTSGEGKVFCCQDRSDSQHWF